MGARTAIISIAVASHVLLALVDIGSLVIGSKADATGCFSDHMGTLSLPLWLLIGGAVSISGFSLTFMCAGCCMTFCKGSIPPIGLICGGWTALTACVVGATWNTFWGSIGVAIAASVAHTCAAHVYSMAVASIIFHFLTLICTLLLTMLFCVPDDEDALLS